MKPATLLDLTLKGNSMNGYNASAVREDRATPGSDPSAPMAACSMRRYLQKCRPLMMLVPTKR